jgi:L-threonylcarbamoyladenylate synthase
MNEVVRAAALLRAGELVAFPTETVYGLGADASNPGAIARIFAAKGRPADHPLIVHLPDAGQLECWAVDIPEAAHGLAAAFWPGPLTLILRRHPSVSDAITGGQDTVGLRVPNHPLALQLLREFGGGVAAPSANRFGRVSPTTAAHVRDELGAAVSMILDGGPCAVGIESTILDLSGRQGADPAARHAGCRGHRGCSRLSARLGRGEEFAAGFGCPRNPLCAGHRVATGRGGELAQALRVASGRRPAHRRAGRSATPPGVPGIACHPASPDPVRFAHDLYAALRELDALGGDLILVAAPPEEEAWRAVNDRLRRAAAGSK